MRLPDPPTPLRARWRSYEPSFVSDTHSLRLITRSRGVHRWELTLDYPVLTREQAQPLLAFLSQLRGRHERFWIIPPIADTPLGAGGNQAVSVAGAIGTSLVETSGWPNATLILKAGDMVQFFGHTKAYMCTADVTSDGAGLADIPIRPQLYDSITVGEGVRATGVGLYGILATDGFEWDYIPKPFIENLTLQFLETPARGVAYPTDEGPPPPTDTEFIDVDMSGDNWLIAVGSSDRALWR